MIKAVFIDMDGTLFNSQREVTENTQIAIRKCIEQKIKIILTSGRSRANLLKYQKMIGTSPYIISSNGADVYDIEKQKEIYIDSIPNQELKRLLEYSQKNDCRITLNYGVELAMNKMFYSDEEPNIKSEEELNQIVEKDKVVQCVIANKDIEKIRKFKAYLEKEILGVKIENESKRLKNPNIKPSKHYYCDITACGTSKGKGVMKMCEYLGLKLTEIAVIGDGENDVSMFKVAKESVAMGNSEEEVKANAKYITETNDNEGVAKFLEKILIKKCECHF